MTTSPVHLAIFAEMVKERPWVPATLKEVGGTKRGGGRLSGRDV